MTDPSDRTVPLPVVQPRSPGGRAPTMGSTRVGRWRAIVLTLVQVLMAAHIIQWAIAGSTLSPVEPSESMQTLENGVINAGAVLFALALLSTMVFGRFFCGWLCHIVALQDACAWLMNKLGVRPKPFRSRLLMWVPLGLGLYMFVWPNFKRLALHPLLDALGVAWPGFLKSVPPITVWRTEMIVEDYWATFAPWYIAVPFLLVCGFAVVYFLGAKGFCTYGCPYGGLFAPLDTVAPVRIRVTDACRQCGHCTSVCTSNVRVSEEVHDFGMVVDPGCMKCLDCVSACPSDALYLGVGTPALLAGARDKDSRRAHKAKQRRRYDLTRIGELCVGIAFLIAFVAFRGMLDQIPMLMAGGMAAIAVFVLCAGWWTIARRDARVYGLTLKRAGKIRIGGVVWLALALLVAGVVAWGASARYPRWRAGIAYAGATIPAAATTRPEFAISDRERAVAERAVGWLRGGDSFASGGRGWTLNAEDRTRLAYFLALLKRYSEAADELDKVVEDGSPGAGLVNQLVRLREMGGASADEIMGIYERVLTLHPGLHHVRLELALKRALASGDAMGGASLFENVPGDDGSVGLRFDELSYYVRMAVPEKAVELFPKVIELAEQDGHNPSGWLADCADVAIKLGENGLALALVEKATSLPGANAGVWFAAAEVAGIAGDGVLSAARIERGLAVPGGDEPAALMRAGGLYLRLSDPERGIALYRRAAASEDLSAYERAQIGTGLCFAGWSYGDETARDEGLAIAQRAAEESGEPMLFHDLAVAAYRAGLGERAAVAMERAAGLAPTNAELALRTRDLWAAAGDQAKADAWEIERARREASTGP